MTLKAVTIKTVDSQAHFSGDPKSYAQKYSYLKTIHLSEEKKESKFEIMNLTKIGQACITPDPYPLCGSFHAGVGWSETILVT